MIYKIINFLKEIKKASILFKPATPFGSKQLESSVTSSFLQLCELVASEIDEFLFDLALKVKQYGGEIVAERERDGGVKEEVIDNPRRGDALARLRMPASKHTTSLLSGSLRS